MEDVVLCLRDGATQPGHAPIALLQDSVGCVGGPAVLCQAIRSLYSALSSRTLPSYGLHMVSRRGKMMYCNHQQDWADRLTWLHLAGQHFMLQGSPSLLGNTILSGAPWHAKTSAIGDVGSIPRKWIVVFEDLSSLILLTGVAQVVSCLDALTSHPSVHCLLACLHQDLHSSAACFALERTAKCIVNLAQASSLASDYAPGCRIDGVMETQCKRRTGRVQVKRECYQLKADGGITCLHDLSGGVQQPVPQAVVKNSTPDLAGGMRLGLSIQEQQARQNVALPYEQGFSTAGSSAAEGALPVDIATQVALGQILYLRDSESEYDSDQDPDDDLDF